MDNKQKLLSPVLSHRSRGGIQAVLSVELKAAIDEGLAHADLSLQLGQLVLHRLLFIFTQATKSKDRKQSTKVKTHKIKKDEADLQISDRFAEGLPLHHIVPGLLKDELGSSQGQRPDRQTLLHQRQKWT